MRFTFPTYDKIIKIHPYILSICYLGKYSLLDWCSNFTFFSPTFFIFIFLFYKLSGIIPKFNLLYLSSNSSKLPSCLLS